MPSDTLDTALTRALLRIPAPKTRKRGARQQYGSVEGEAETAFLSAVFGGLSPEERLYPLSGSAYRRRWDALLKALGLPAHLHLTPGGLRGGGAVSAFHQNPSIELLLWRMRLKSQTTLAHYLQEVGAAVSLLGLTEPVRERLRALNRLYEPALQLAHPFTS